jgi:hypothetical protein
MKIHSLIALIPMIGAVAIAQPKEGSFQTPAVRIDENGSQQPIWLVAATKTAVRYRETEVAVSTVDVKLNSIAGVYVIEPREYTEAMNLFEARKYAEAKAKFAKVKEEFKPIYPLPDSPAALAAFHELECLRKLGDLEGLSAALQNFDKEPLTRESQLRQLELYVMWDAVRTKSWQRLDVLAKERQQSRLPGEQRAQIAYCHGLALEGLNRPEDAIFAYQTALTADAGASEQVARQAALRILAIHKADAGVQGAMKTWGGKGENKNTKAYADLTEAAAVAKLYELALGGGSPLPDEYKEFLIPSL